MNSRRQSDHTTPDYRTRSTNDALYHLESRQAADRDDDLYETYRSTDGERYAEDGQNAYPVAHHPDGRYSVDADIWPIDNEQNDLVNEFPDEEITLYPADDGYHEYENDHEHQDYAAAIDADSGYASTDYPSGDYDSGDYDSGDYRSDYRDGVSIPDFVSESHSRTSFKDGELTDADFFDVGTAKNGFKPAKVAALTFGIICLCAFAVALVVSIKPQLSKLEIVQLDGYGGQQVARQIHYSAQLNNCSGSKDCSSEPELLTTENSPAQSNGNTQTDTPLVAAGRQSDIREIPAASLGTTSDWQQPAPQYVLYQWSNVRSGPAGNSSIVTSLAKGTAVNPIRREGEWFEIEVPGKEGEAGTVGFMHQSTVSEDPSR